MMCCWRPRGLVAGLVLLSAGAVPIEAAAADGRTASDGPPAFPVFADDRWGLMGRDGKMLTEPQYDAIGSCGGPPAATPPRPSGALARALLSLTLCYGLPPGPVRMLRDGRWGFLDRTGGELVPPRYERAEHFSEGLAAVRAGGLWGYIDASGREAIAARFEAADDFRDGVAAVRVGGQWGLIGRDGAWRAPPQFEKFERRLRDSAFDASPVAAKRDGRWGFVTLAGERVIPPRFDDASPFSEGLALVRMGGRAGYVDRSGTVVIPPRYLIAGPFSEGRAPVEVQSKRFGYIDGSGRLVVPAIYSFAFGFRSGLARVRVGDRWACIDREGRVVVPAELDCGDVDGDLVSISRNRLGGWANLGGRIVIEPRFEKKGRFSDGVAAIRLDGRWGYVDRHGTLVIEPRFEHADAFRHGLGLVEYGDSAAYIDRSGTVIREMHFPGRAGLLLRP
jgi:hypothetical protein